MALSSIVLELLIIVVEVSGEETLLKLGNFKVIIGMEVMTTLLMVMLETLILIMEKQCITMAHIPVMQVG